MSNGIKIDILGDSDPFSVIGKSTCYKVSIGQSSFLLDCGAPLFSTFSGRELSEIKGLIITHCHDDHKRWFSDMAFFGRYSDNYHFKVPLMTSEDVYNDLGRSAASAMDRSLSDDSKTVIDIAYKDYLNHLMLGPRARFKIVYEDKGDGTSALRVVDSSGNTVSADKAKIIISDKTARPRMLFKDPVYKEWVEPESFYPFSSSIFYEENKNIYADSEGFVVEAVKAPVWHGIPGIGVRFSTANETIMFSSDTVHDKELWAQLYQEKRKQNLQMSDREFELSGVIYGDINNFIERTWGEERYREAVNAFSDAIVVHDIAASNSVVHTRYDRLKQTALKSEMTLLTHSPDTIISEWALSETGKRFRVDGSKLFEVVNGKLFEMTADIYFKENGKHYVGYRNENGRYSVYEEDNMLSISSEGTYSGNKLYQVDLFEDISGRYFPKLEDSRFVYRERSDGRVELLEECDDGSRSEIVRDQRKRLSKKMTCSER